MSISIQLPLEWQPQQEGTVNVRFPSTTALETLVAWAILSFLTFVRNVHTFMCNVGES